MRFFQLVGRKSDVNGNPFRLVLVYDAAGLLVEAWESRSSSPNVRAALYEVGAVELITSPVMVAPMEYRRLRRLCVARCGVKLDD